MGSIISSSPTNVYRVWVKVSGKGMPSIAGNSKRTTGIPNWAWLRLASTLRIRFWESARHPQAAIRARATKLRITPTAVRGALRAQA